MTRRVKPPLQARLPYKSEFVSSNLPAGFTLRSAGILSSTGDPAAAPGNYVVTIVAKDAERHTATKMFPLTVLSPDCAALVNAAITLSICDLNSATPCKTPEMQARFTPQPCYSLADAAKACGVDKFNWQQWVTNLPLPSPFRAISQPTVSLFAPPAFLDPPAGGAVYDPQSGNALPFCYDASTLEVATQTYTLSFVDSPHDGCLPNGDGSGCSGEMAPPGSAMYCLSLGPLYTTPSLEGTVQRPGATGGGNWGGAAVDPGVSLCAFTERHIQ